MSKVNNRTIGENSPNLIILPGGPLVLKRTTLDLKGALLSLVFPQCC
jgi:hypothetical protein